MNRARARFERYIKRRFGQTNTLKHYISDLNIFIDTVDNKAPEAVTAEDIDTFVESRESMIPTLGMQSYADIMSPFANGERLINRAWSASADGYVDEVRACIAGARVELENAAKLLGESRQH